MRALRSLTPLAVVGLLLGSALGFWLTPRVAYAAVSDLLVTLNGSEEKVGTLVSAGTSVSNTTTATPFTITPGRAYSAQCPLAAVHMGPGATAHATPTNASFKPLRAMGSQYYWVANVSTVSMIPVSGSADCAVFEMK